MIHYNRLKPYNENKELFFTKNKIAPQSQTQPQTQSQTDSSQSDWLEIKRILNRKKIKGKNTRLVYGMDGTTENITDYAKIMHASGPYLLHKLYYSKFVLKIANFCCHGNRGRYESNLISTV